MESEADEGYKYILNYQNHHTKMVTLRPLKTKRAEEVSHHLVDIFCTFGAPTLLHTDNGREFCNSVFICSILA
jgi:hypothetical protein